jgi:hypothetical protein
LCRKPNLQWYFDYENKAKPMMNRVSARRRALRKWRVRLHQESTRYAHLPDCPHREGSITRR